MACAFKEPPGCAIALDVHLLLHVRAINATLLCTCHCRHKADGAPVGRLADSQKRSINLALSHRGREALRALGLEDRVMEQTVRMSQRAIHSKNGKMSYQPYGRKDQAIYSVSRQMLNHLLLDEAEKLDNVNLFFSTRIVRVDKDGTLHFEREGKTQELKTRCVIGTDGAYSAVRSSLLRNSRANFSRLFIPHGYKELELPATPEGDFAFPTAEALHIWPRHEFMLIALPNPDRSFTCTLFAPFKTCTSFFIWLDRRATASATHLC